MRMPLPALMLAGLLFSTAPQALQIPSPLVEPAWLAAHRGQVVLLDVRDGAAMNARIPGAVPLDRNALQARRTEQGLILDGMAPAPEAFAALMAAKGVSEDSTVVITHPGERRLDLAYAARLYWTLKYFGHDKLALLNGGNAQWQKEGGKLVDTRIETPHPGRFVARPNPELLATTEQVAAAVQRNNAQRVDVRTLGYYLGLYHEPSVETAGHIPGAGLYPWTLALHGRPVRFRPLAQLRELADAFRIDLSAPTFLYCNTGVLSAVGWFIHHELLGNPRARLYDGSMHAWSRSGKPVQTMSIHLPQSEVAHRAGPKANDGPVQ